jgi:hypothetical protein
MIARLTALVFIFAAMIGVCFAQQNAPYHFSNCTAAATCCVVPVPLNNQPVPGGTPTTSSNGSVILYGFHVSNTNAASEFVQLFNATAQPAAGVTPIGASSWVVPTAQDRDVSIGGNYGMPFTVGAQACCSSTQGTFTAVGGCGFILEYY